MAWKHLPGPWFVSRDPRHGMEWNNHIASVEHPHLQVCSMFHTNDQDDNETGEANARLVAAAPEMLAFLYALREAYQDGLTSDEEKHEDQDEQTRYLVAELDAVIAKATSG